MRQCLILADMSDDDLLTSSEAGALLRRSYRTVQRLAASGELPVERKLPGPNGAYLFRRRDVEQLARRLEEAQADTGADKLPGLEVDVA